jgi:membrane-bound lytic murein transglycosylase B
MKYSITLLCSFLLNFNIFANEEFNNFIKDIKQKSLSQGVSTQTLTILDGIIPNPRIMELDNSQAEFSLNFWQYINSRVSPNRTLVGGLKMLENDKLFKQVYNKYGVPKQILIAFWGLESNFGVNTGGFNLVRSLATLAFDKRRRTFFTTQLLTTLKLIDDNKLDKNTKSSWAGAMGSVQFMPSNVKSYGIDFDKDGKINLWDSEEDIFHSAANFLSHIGWNKGEKWGREVLLPDVFDYSLANLKIKKSLTQWSDLGVVGVQTKNFPKSTLKASLVLPMGHKGPAFLVYRNFRAILNWNRSTLYALSVGILADKLIGKKLRAEPFFEPKLSKADVKFVQQNLNDAGFDVGKVDGISGRQTRAAVRNYQKHNKIPADGYIGIELINYMKNNEKQ